MGVKTYARMMTLAGDLIAFISSEIDSLSWTNEAKKAFVVAAALKFFDSVFAVQFPVAAMFIRPAVVAVLPGLVDWIYQRVVKPKMKSALI